MRLPRKEWVAVLVSLAVMASCNDSDQSATTTSERNEPAGTPATETVPVAPTSVEADTLEAQIAAAEEIARGFLETRSSDPDRAMSYATDDIIAQASGSAEEFRLEGAMLAALGDKTENVQCEHETASASAVTVRCTYDHHTFRSEELGRDPFTGSWSVVTVREGKIVSLDDGYEPPEGDAFFQQMWASFHQWIGREHPDDVSVMYAGNGWRLTRESIALWEQYTKEYAEAQG